MVGEKLWTLLTINLPLIFQYLDRTQAISTGNLQPHMKIDVSPEIH